MSPTGVMDHKEEETDSSDYEEIVEESLIHVVMDNPDDLSTVNINSNVRLKAVVSDSPVLQIENQVYHFKEWKYIMGTAMFFEKKNDAKPIDLLYDNRCASELQYVGSTRKSLEMTKKENAILVLNNT